MRRRQIIQLLQFIVIWIWIALFVIFVMEKSFIDFVLKYWLYLLIVSISYFYYYSIQYQLDKKYEYIRNIIIYGNVYLFAHIFFRPLLNISHQLFFLLWLIILWLWWLSKLKTRWKVIWQIFWVFFSFFILISWVFYLYPEKPDIQWFINSRYYTISVFWLVDNVEKVDAYIQIINNRRTDDFLLESNFEKILSENCEILYPSLKKDRKENVVIQSPYGEIYLLYPQSEIQLEFSWKFLSRVNKINWRLWYFSGFFSSSTKNDFERENESEELNDFVENLQNLYKYDLIGYLKNQISKNYMSLVNNTIMYNIDWIIIKYLARMFPSSFAKNLDNYNEFQKYFAMIPSEEIKLSRYFDSKKSGNIWGWFWSSIKNNIKIWIRSTYLWN